MNAFAYTAQQPDGTLIRGTLDAPDAGEAHRQLRAMGLSSIELAGTSVLPEATRAAPLGPADLQTFNEFLLQISRAGLPVEAGLVALSRELQSGKLKSAIDALAEDLRAGVPLERAVAGRRGSFPPLYGHLIDAGVQSADLPGVLGRFGKHTQTVADLRSALWRATSYPAVVFIALTLLMTFLGYAVLPNYFALITKSSYINWGGSRWFPTGVTERSPMLPVMAWVMLYVGRLAPFLLALIMLIVAAIAIVYAVLRSQGRERGMVDALTRLPIVGRALRDSYVASWLDVASLGAGAGLDLPRALRLAGRAVALPSIERDTEALAARLESGQRAGDVTLSRLPATLPLVIDLAAGPNELTNTLSALAYQYEQQARRQIALLPGRVMPVLLAMIGLLAGGVMYSLWVPLAELLRALTGAT